jgi:hypothetical protein
MWAYSKQSKYFWHRHNISFPFWPGPNSDHTLPCAAVLSRLEWSGNSFKNIHCWQRWHAVWSAFRASCNVAAFVLNTKRYVLRAQRFCLNHRFSSDQLITSTPRQIPSNIAANRVRCFAWFNHCDYRLTLLEASRAPAHNSHVAHHAVASSPNSRKT